MAGLDRPRSMPCCSRCRSDHGARAGAGRHRRDGAHRQGARPRCRADHRLPLVRILMVLLGCRTGAAASSSGSDRDLMRGAVEAPGRIVLMTAGAEHDRIATVEETGNGEQQPENRLDRHGPHGLSHGRAAAQGRLRRLDLEPHPRQGRAAGGQGRQDRRQALRSRTASTCCSRSSPTGKDVEEVYFGKDGVVTSQRRQAAEDLRRLLDHRGRGVRRDPRQAQGARRRFRRGAGVRQRQGDQGRPAVGGALRRRRPPARPSRR